MHERVSDRENITDQVLVRLRLVETSDDGLPELRQLIRFGLAVTQRRGVPVADDLAAHNRLKEGEEQ